MDKQDTENMKSIGAFIKRRSGNLPHWQQPGGFYFVTFSTARNRQLSETAKDIVVQAFKHFDSERYNLVSLVVMNDHCHTILHPLEIRENIFHDLSSLMRNIKGYSAYRINKIEDKSGENLWNKESYDRIIRNDKEFYRFLVYIALNANKAGLVDKPDNYKWYYLSDGYRKDA